MKNILMMKYSTMLIENQKSKIVNCLAILLSAILAFIPIGAIAQQETDEFEQSKNLLKLTTVRFRWLFAQ